MNVMMLAAGEGSRLRPYTLKRPKPAIPFLNIPLAAHSLSTLSGLKKNKLIVNTYHLPQQVRALFNELPHGFEKLVFSDETVLLGSGGGIKKVQAELENDDFILMNADEVILPQNPDFLKNAIAQHKANGNIATLITMKHPEAGGKFGAIWTDSTDKVRAIGKVPTANTQPWHFIGIQILSPQIFKFLPDVGESNILYDGVLNALQNGHSAQIYPIECTWFETGNIHDYWEGSKASLDILAGTDSHERRHLVHTFEQFDRFNNYEVLKKENGVCLISKGSLLNRDRIEGYVVAGNNSSASVQNIKDIVITNNASYVATTEERIIF